jgi:anti-anti-sigma regulatory factor
MPIVTSKNRHLAKENPMTTVLAPVKPVTNVTRHEPADRFDVHHLERFRADVARAPGDLVIDLSRTRFLDVAALQALVDARAALLDRNCELWVDGLSQAARITIELAGLAEAFPALDHGEQAAA